MQADRLPELQRLRRLRQMPQLAASMRSTMHLEKGGKGERTVMPLAELLERLRQAAAPLCCMLLHTVTRASASQAACVSARYMPLHELLGAQQRRTGPPSHHRPHHRYTAADTAADTAATPLAPRKDERQIVAPAELEEMLAILAELVPHWYSVSSSLGHRLARIDNTVKFATVMLELNALAPPTVPSS